MLEYSKIKEKLDSHKDNLREKYQAIRFWLFGSYARGDYNENSDIDLLVEFSDDIDLLSFVDLKEDLESILGKKVDLGTPGSLKSIIKEQILNEAILL